MEQQEELEGIGDMGEDYGDKNHQDEAKTDRHISILQPKSQSRLKKKSK